jgi:hypothetical protein
MTYIWSVAVIAILVLFFLASVIHQLRLGAWSRIDRYDAFHLLPRYSFFAPHPARHDTHVVYRDRIKGIDGPWLQLQPSHIDRRWRWVWNPNRYQRKAVSDLANAILADARQSADCPRVVLLSSPYVSLLYWVMAQPPSGSGVTHRQFALVGTHGFGDTRQLEVRFLSEVHRSVS